MNTSERISGLRLSREWSQADLARRMGLSDAWGYLQVSAWETGRQRPSAKNLVRLADALGVSADELLGSRALGPKPPAAASHPLSAPGEEWRDVPGFEGKYRISSHGRLIVIPGSEESSNGKNRRAFKRVRRAREKRPDLAGRLRHTLFSGGVAQRFLVAHLVLLAFRGAPPGRIGLHDGEYSSNHINGDFMDNRLENLEWLTNEEHRRHTVANGLHSRHESHNKAKLKWPQVREIRSRFNGNARALAAEFGVTRNTIYSIVHGRTWREDGQLQP